MAFETLTVGEAGTMWRRSAQLSLRSAASRGGQAGGSSPRSGRCGSRSCGGRASIEKRGSSVSFWTMRGVNPAGEQATQKMDGGRSSFYSRPVPSADLHLPTHTTDTAERSSTHQAEARMI